MRHLAYMGIPAWRQRQIKWFGLRCRDAGKDVIILHDQRSVDLPGQQQVLWHAMFKAFKQWQACPVQMTREEFGALSADTEVYYLSDCPSQFQTAARVSMMPTLNSMVEDSSKKAILWHAIKHTFTHN